MATSFLGLRTAVYHVGDLQLAKEWYSKAFEVEPYFDEPFYVGFNIEGYELGLQPAYLPTGQAGRTGRPKESPTDNKVKSVSAYWGVNNIVESYGRLIDVGATAYEPPQNVGGDIEVASVKDPWGNIIGILYNPEFKL